MTRLSCFGCFLLLSVALHHSPTAVAQDDTSIDHEQFADSLTTALYANENECTSAWGVSMAFSLVYPSSIDDSEEQIRTVLGYPDGTKLRLVWDDTATSIDEAYQGECLSENAGECFMEAPQVEIANSVWVDENTTLNPEYADVVGEYLRQIDFEDEGAGGLVNDWVTENTNGLIDSIVPEGSLYPPFILLALNSIYLKASWQSQFSDQRTNQDVFYSSPSRSLDAPTTEARFMHQVDSFAYSHDALSGFQIVRLEFVGGPLSMLFVLPLSEASGMASSADVIGAIPELVPRTRVALSIPKFKFESTYEDALMSSLQSIGLSAPFEGGLCIESPTVCNAFISLIIQKTFIDVNEMGVEAAAVTMMGMATSMPPPQAVPFVADHPFQFFIYDETQDLVLFEGRVGNPGIDEDEPPVAPFNAQHSDVGFWEDNFFVELMDVPVPEPAVAVVAPISSDTSIDHEQFADSLTTALYANENECTSAWGVSMAFSLVYPSSIDDSEDQIRTVLGYPDGTKLRLVWNDTATSIDEAYQGACINEFRGECSLEEPQIEIANSVWVDINTTLNPEYAAVVGEYLRQVDFEDEGAGDIVNEWVSDNTNGLIDSIVPEGSLYPPYILLALNSIYFKASWVNQFSEDRTNQDIFYSSPSRSLDAPTTEARFMHQVESFPYSHDALSGFQIVKLDFVSVTEGRDYPLSMLFVLPLGEASGMASSADVIDAVPELTRTRVALALPKFKFESTYQDALMSSLQSIGLTAPFEGGLCIESPTVCNAFINLIVQKTFIDVNEMGVEAAAVTMMGMATSMPPPQAVPFVADHPFQFFIYDETEDLVLFEGRVGNPGIDEDEPPVALFDPQHADEGFWEDNFYVELMDVPHEVVITPISDERSSCLVGDIMHQEGDSIGHIGIECLNETSYAATASSCGPNGEIIDTKVTMTCSESVPYCVQCRPAGRGAALCLSSPDLPDHCEGVVDADEDYTDEDVADEDVAEEDVADEDVADEDVADEDVTDEDVTDPIDAEDPTALTSTAFSFSNKNLSCIGLWLVVFFFGMWTS